MLFFKWEMAGFTNAQKQTDSRSSNSYTDSSNYYTEDSNKQNKSQDPSSYSSYKSFSSTQDSNNQNTFSDQNYKKSNTNSTFYSEKQERNTKYNDVNDDYLYHPQILKSQDQHPQNINKPQYLKAITPLKSVKKLQELKLIDIIQYPLQKQQYLKSLSLDQFGNSAQVKFLYTRPQTLFGICFYFKDSMENKELRNQMIKLKRRQKMFEPFFAIGLYTYFLTMQYFQRSKPSFFRGYFKKFFNSGCPFGIILLIAIYGNIFFFPNKKDQLVKDEYNKIQIRNAIRKYFCEGSKEDRVNIILRS